MKQFTNIVYSCYVKTVYEQEIYNFTKSTNMRNRVKRIGNEIIVLYHPPKSVPLGLNVRILVSLCHKLEDLSQMMIKNY